jgi:hypothetical protein
MQQQGSKAGRLEGRKASNTVLVQTERLNNTESEFGRVPESCRRTDGEAASVVPVSFC